jgi:hypothetical protein
VGNQRLLRGPGGLGTTQIQNPNSDRDTYVTPGTANFSSTLLAGRSSTYEARAFFKFTSFNLPDTNRTGFVPGDVLFELPEARLRRTPLDLDLQFGLTDAAVPDSAVIGWPGPGMGTQLGSITYDFSGNLRLSLGPGSFNQFKQWALNPSSVPGFILRAPLVQGVAGFASNRARFRVPYTWNNAGTTVSDTITTLVTFDVYLHPPISPAATGADTALVLGGGFESSLAIHAPVPVIEPGASVNQLRLVLAVIDSLPGVDGSILKDASDTSRVAVSLAIYRITGPWTEGVTDEASTPHSIVPTALVLNVAVTPGDSLSVPLPTSLARGWAENPASNDGILISIRSANINPGIVVGSRESSRPPVLRVSTTSPPPGRF